METQKSKGLENFYDLEKSIVTTKIEISRKQMNLLKLNKKYNGITIGFALSKAVDLYIDEHGLDELMNDYVKIQVENAKKNLVLSSTNRDNSKSSTNRGFLSDESEPNRNNLSEPFSHPQPHIFGPKSYFSTKDKFSANLA